MAQVKVGDVVTLPSERPPNWNKKGEMDHFLGKSVVVTNAVGNVFWFNGSGLWQFLLSDLDYKEIEFCIGKEVGLKKIFKVFRVLPNHMFDICDDDGNCIRVSETQIYTIIKTEKQMKAMKDAVLAVAKNLLNANNTVTTLEVKNELRRDYPYYFWTQDVVSDFMSQLASDGVLSYKDNGTYRIYSLIKAKAVTVSTPIAKSLGTTGIVGISKPAGSRKRGRPCKATSTPISQSMALGYAKDPAFESVTINRKSGKVYYSVHQIRAQKKSPLAFVNRDFGKIAAITVANKTYQVI